LRRAGCVALCLLALVSASASAAPRVEAISPNGSAKGVRQVALRFNAPMAPLGDPGAMRDPASVRCTPAAAGASRWVDERSWVFDFDAALPGAVRCQVRLARGLRTLAGERITGRRRFAFDTGGPAVLAMAPAPGAKNAIEEDARFVLRLDAVPDDGALEKAAYLEDAASSRRIALRIVTGTERDDLLRAVTKARLASDFVFAPRSPLTPSRGLTLVWRGKSRGLRAATPQRFEYRTRDPLELVPACEGGPCDPAADLELRFNAAIASSSAEGMRLVPLGEHAKQAARPLTETEWTWRGQSFVAKGPFPQRSHWRVEIPPGLRDESGRTLASAPPPTVMFGAYRTQAWFRQPVSIAEPEGAAWHFALHAVPSGARLREHRIALAELAPRDQARTVDAWLRGFLGGERERWEPLGPAATSRADDTQETQLPPTPDDEVVTSVAVPIEGLGLRAATLEGVLLDGASSRPPGAITQVTNLAVHLKASSDRSLVWVTQLRDTAPVAGARVHVFDCDLGLLGSGLTDARGIASIAHRALACADARGGVVLAQRGADVAFLHLRFAASPAGDWNGYFASFAPDPLVRFALATNLLRRGESLHGKVFVRIPTLSGMTAPPTAENAGAEMLPIVHVETGEHFATPLRFDARGNALIEWQVPLDAPLGEYELGDSGSGSFRVEDFRPPLVTGSIRIPDGANVAPAQLPLDLELTYLAGGPAADLPIEIRTSRAPKWVQPPEELSEFTFNAGELRADALDSDDWDEWDEEDEGWTFVAPWEQERRKTVEQIDEIDAGEPAKPDAKLTLDAHGRGRAEVPLSNLDAAQVVLVEASFRDPNGATQTLTQRFDVWSAAVQVGVTSTLTSDSRSAPARIEAVVLDLDQKPLAGAPVELLWGVAEDRDVTRRLPGGFSITEERPAGISTLPLCSGRSDERGHVECSAPPPPGEEVYVIARARDEAGRRCATHAELDRYFDRRLDARLSLSPDKTDYAPGDRALIEVETAFEAATALVTIEREGIAEHRIVALRGGAATVDLPVRASYAPNVHVAVLALEGSRGPGPPPLAPRAPDAASASISIEVRPSRYSLDVSVQPERDVYAPRDAVHTQIRVRASDRAPLPNGGEVALAVVDEALLELLPNESWDLAAFLREPRPRSVLTATTQSLGVESASAPFGGWMPFVAAERESGVEEITVTARKREENVQDVPVSVTASQSRGAARERFDSLVLWRGVVELDASGGASMSIPLNDSLSRFRIVALASAGVDRFGTGAASIRTAQPLQIYSGVPPLVREGDRAHVEFTLRNTTGRFLRVTARLSLEGSDERFDPQQVELGAGKAKPVGFDVLVPLGVASLTWDLEAEATDGARDRIRVAQRVLPVAPERVLQGTLVRVAGEARVAVQRPESALPSRGGIDVMMRSSLAGGTDGIRAFLDEYPYRCLEQEASIAVGRRDPQRWRQLAAALRTRLDRLGFATFFPGSEHGSEVLTAYLVSIADAAGYEIPEEPLDRMLDALVLFALDKVEPFDPVGAADLTYRRLAALEAISRHRRSDPELAAAVPRERPELWPTSALLDALGIAGRWPGAGPPREELIRVLRARLVLGGTTLSFAHEDRDRLDWLFAGGDVNAARLAWLAQDLSELEADGARLLRGALARQHGGRWDTTVANAWGRLALEAFAAKHERDAVGGVTHAQLGGASAAFAWEAPRDPPKQRLAWPPASAELTLRHDGTGQPWAEVQSVASEPLAEPRMSGFRVARAWRAISQKTPGRWSRGDVVRVRVDLEALGSFAWVAVSDPIPPGATILGSGLGRDSGTLTQSERGSRSRWSCPCVETVERTFEAYREFYSWAPAGRWSIEYTLRLDLAGEFTVPPTRVEAMYAPESFAELPHDRLVVER